MYIFCSKICVNVRFYMRSISYFNVSRHPDVRLAAEFYSNELISNLSKSCTSNVLVRTLFKNFLNVIQALIL